MKIKNAQTNSRISKDISDTIKKTQEATLLWAVCRRISVSASLLAVVVGALGVNLSAAKALGASEERRVVAGELLNQKTPTPGFWVMAVINRGGSSGRGLPPPKCYPYPQNCKKCYPDCTRK